MMICKKFVNILILIYLIINFYVMNSKLYNKLLQFTNVSEMKITNFNINVITIILIYIF